jgi:hypothetical protein
MAVDDVAADFQAYIVLAHPSFPWQDEVRPLALKANAARLLGL